MRMEGRTFRKKEWGLGKDQMRLRNGERFGKEWRVGERDGSGYWEREED